MLRSFLWLALGLSATTAWSADASTTRAVERKRIEREQVEAEAVFQRQQAACLQQFVVSPCIDRAKVERREKLQNLRQQRNIVDSEDRKARAAERLKSIEDKQREAAARPPPATRASEPEPREPASARHSAPAPRKPVDRSNERLEAQQRAADQRERQAQAQSHRDAVERRNAERAVKKKPAAPLPVPPAGSGVLPAPASPAVPAASG